MGKRALHAALWLLVACEESGSETPTHVENCARATVRKLEWIIPPIVEAARSDEPVLSVRIGQTGYVIYGADGGGLTFGIPKSVSLPGVFGPQAELKVTLLSNGVVRVTGQIDDMVSLRCAYELSGISMTFDPDEAGFRPSGRIGIARFVYFPSSFSLEFEEAKGLMVLRGDGSVDVVADQRTESGTTLTIEFTEWFVSSLALSEPAATGD